MALSARHQIAVDEYLKGRSMTQACMAAGYSESVAKSNGRRLFRREDVKAEIARRREETMHKVKVTPDWILQNLRDLVANPHTKDSDRLRAIEMLAKHLGMLKETDVSVNVNFNKALAEARNRIRKPRKEEK